MGIYVTLFIAGFLTILLPCVLPLVPIVLGSSLAGTNKWRPLVTIIGMLAGFVGVTYLLQTVLDQFVELADYIRIGTYYVLFLFGISWLRMRREASIVLAILGALFFVVKGWTVVLIAAGLGIFAVEYAHVLGDYLQRSGWRLQRKTKNSLGEDSMLTAFAIGLTMGLVWAPCAGPALSFVLTLIREDPHMRTLLYLLTYATGAAVPLLAIGYGGQQLARPLHAVTHKIRQVSGLVLMLTAIGFHFHLFEKIQVWMADNTAYGNIGVDVERQLFEDKIPNPVANRQSSSSAPVAIDVPPEPEPEPQQPYKSNLPILARAPEVISDGPWHNSDPLTLADLRGQVVLIDFWTFDCINCIRTFPHVKSHYAKYHDQGFEIIAIHAPEFTHEKSEANVVAAIKRHDLPYPVVQDNDFKTWRAYNNRYWPAHYLIDVNGNIRYTHFGEGKYDEMAANIEDLLREANDK